MSKSLISTLCCLGESEKSWAEGADAGDAKYEPVDKGNGLAADDKRICVPQKIDPKTFFANERTFLKWLSISVMIGLMSLTLLNFSDASTDGAALAGMILLPVALMFMCYSLIVFRSRADKIYMREPMRYDDTRGPTVLVTVLALSMLVSTVFSLQKHYGRTAASSVPQDGGHKSFY